METANIEGRDYSAEYHVSYKNKQIYNQSIRKYYNKHCLFLSYVPCLEGDEVRAEFDRIVYDKAIRFHDGYGGQITSVTETIKITAAFLDKEHKQGVQDVYMVAENFSWTYVKTHENGWYEPYFCYRIPEI